jgi:hypothetical protein
VIRYFSRSLAINPDQEKAAEMAKAVEELSGIYRGLHQD